MAGVLSTWYNTAHTEGNEAGYFGILGAASIVIGVVPGLFTTPISRLLRGVR
jgi:hypothetical protein